MFNSIKKKTERIKRNSLIAPTFEGGIGIIDTETKLKVLKASLVNRLIDKNSINRIQHVFINCLLKDHLSIEYVLKALEADLNKFTMIHVLPRFYQEIFSCFNCFKSNKSMNQYSSNEILIEPIWNNTIFKYRNNTRFYFTIGQKEVYYMSKTFLI